MNADKWIVIESRMRADAARLGSDVHVHAERHATRELADAYIRAHRAGVPWSNWNACRERDAAAMERRLSRPGD